MLTLSLKKSCPVLALYAKWEPYSVNFAGVKMEMSCFPKGFAVLLASLLRCEMKVKC